MDSSVLSQSDDTRHLLAKIVAEIHLLHEKIDRAQGGKVVSPSQSGTFNQSDAVQPLTGSSLFSTTHQSMRSERTKSSGHGSTWRTIVKKNFQPATRTQSLHRAAPAFRSASEPRPNSPDSARSVSPVVASGELAGILQHDTSHSTSAKVQPPSILKPPDEILEAPSDPSSPTLLQAMPAFGDSSLSGGSLVTTSFEVSEGGTRRRKRLPSTVEHIPLTVSEKLHSLTHPTWKQRFAVITKWIAGLTVDPNSTIAIAFDVGFVASTAGYILALLWVFVHPDSTTSVFDLPSGLFVTFFIVLQVYTILWSLTRMFMRFKNDYEVIDDASQIREAYFKSIWFAMDVFLCIPFDFIFLAFYPLLFYIALCRHPLLRIVRIAKLAQSADPLLPTSRAWILIVTFFAFTVCIAHAAVCIFWRLEVTDSTSGEPLTYIDALYWVIATLSSTGYGDVSARQQSSRFFAVFLMLVGMAIVSATTAIVTTFLSNKDALEEEHDRMRRMMGSMLRHYSIPWDLQKDVVTLFPSVLSNTSEQQFKQMIQQLPPFMEQRVESYLRAKLLRQIPLFHSLPEREENDVLLKLSQKMKTIHVQPYEYIINAGDTGDEMYILVHGTVDVLVPTGSKVLVHVTHEDGTFSEAEETEEKRVATLRSGSFFGEIALIEDCTRVASVVALQNCEILVLTRESFMEAVHKSPALQASLDAAAKQRHEAIDNQKKAVIAKMNQAQEGHGTTPPRNPLRAAMVKIKDHHEIVMPPRAASSDSMGSLEGQAEEQSSGDPIHLNKNEVLVEDVTH